MRQEIQQEGGGKEPGKEIVVGVLQAAESANQGPACVHDAEKADSIGENAGRERGNGKASRGGWTFGGLTMLVTPSGLILFLIWLYQKAVSPWIPPCCRFTPTCSEYAAEAVRRHGFFFGTLLAAGRLLRCQPFCRGGYDPVPEKLFWK